MKPAWLTEAERWIGTKEAPGTSNNPVIMGWANKLGVKALGIVYGADSIPWCGLFAAHCVSTAGLKPPAIAVRAKAWASFGGALDLHTNHVHLGAIAVFSRAGGGHVGFVTGIYSNGDLQILGGNQGDEVNKRRFTRQNLAALRLPDPSGMWPDAPLVKSGQAAGALA